MKFFNILPSPGFRFKTVIDTAAGVCQIGAVGAAVWAFFFPEKAADHWARFEVQVEEARADLARIEETNAAIAASTRDVAESSKSMAASTQTMAHWVEDMASIERGLEVYSYASMDLEDAQRANFWINIGNLSTTPINNFKFALLNSEQELIGARETARLIQTFNVDAEFSMVIIEDQLLVDDFPVWLCASGDIGGTASRAFFTMKLVGYVNSGDHLVFNVASNEITAEPNEICSAQY